MIRLFSGVMMFLCFWFLSGGPAGAATCSSVSYFSRNTQTEIKWILDKSYECGQFANGDWWVLGPVVITRITPDYTGRFHGWEVNPLPTGPQGFDDRPYLDFNANRVPSLPYIAQPNQSIVKAISRNITNEQCESQDRPCLQTAAVLTVLPSIPANNGSTFFRPPYVGTEKPLLSIDSIRMELLPSIDFVPLAGVDDLVDIKNRFQPLQLDHRSWGGGRVLRPLENMPNYGGSIGRDTNAALLKLVLKYPLEDRKQAMIPLLQYGLDLYQMHLLGHAWNQGGITNGRRPHLSFTAMMLGHQEMKNLLVSGPYPSTEDGLIQSGKNGALFGGAYKYFELGERAYWNSVSNGGTSGDKMVGDPYGYIDGGGVPGNNYTNIVSPTTKASTLLATFMPSIREAWYEKELDEVINFADRYYTRGLQTQPDPCAPYSGSMNDYGVKFGPNGKGGCIQGSGRFHSLHGKHVADSGTYGSKFITQMWETYRNLIPPPGSNPTPPPPDPTPFVPGGQSEMVKAVFNPLKGESGVLKVHLEKPGHVTATVYSRQGIEIALLVDADNSAGPVDIVWNGKNRDGSVVASGVYVVTIKYEGKLDKKKMVVVK